MKHIRVKTESDLGFQVCGRHANVYDVELPEWLPDEILEAMIEKFRFFAYQQLSNLNSPPDGGPGQTHNPSCESNMSAETASSGVSIPDAQEEDNNVVGIWL
jgi:hypothetical protein